jgi:hypothetical protein
MLRRLFTLFAGLSLLLWVAVIVFWVRSYQVNDAWNGDVTYGHAVYSKEGLVTIFSRWGPPPFQSPPGSLRTSVLIPIPEQPKEHLLPGFRWTERWLALDSGRPADFTFRFQRSVAVSYWLVAILSAVIPATWLLGWRGRRRRRRHAMGQCVACGYDLRATPERCPECGALPAVL